MGNKIWLSMHPKKFRFRQNRPYIRAPVHVSWCEMSHLEFNAYTINVDHVMDYGQLTAVSMGYPLTLVT